MIQNGHKKAKNANETTDEAPSFIEILNRAHSNRLDDQRCSVKRLTLNNRTNMTPAATPVAKGPATFKDPSTLIKNELMKEENYCKNDAEASIPNDEFFNLIMKSQKSRLEDQRSSLSMPKNLLSTPVLTSNDKHRSSHLESSISSSNTSSSMSNAPSSLEPVSAPSSSISLGSFSSKFLGGSAKKQHKPPSAPPTRQAVTVPSDDAFFSMLQKIQSRRLDEQRSVIKRSTLPTR